MQRVPLNKLSYDEAYGLYCYEGGPFTGTAYVTRRGGTLEAETEYQHGLRSGLHREWHRDGSLAAEGSFRDGVIHGTYREWHENHQLALEQVCEYGITLSQKKWAEQGLVVEDYAIKEGDPDWQAVQQRRKLFDK